MSSIFYVHDFMDWRLRNPISISALAARFSCGRDRVKKARTHGFEPFETRGRHPAMSDDAEREILSWIQTNAAKNKKVTPKDLR
jgi:transposase